MALAAPQPRVLADTVPTAWVRNIVLVVGAAAFVAVCAQIAIPLPFTPVPLTLQTFAVVLSAGVLGSWRGAAAMLLYAVVGSLGAPIFFLGSSGFGGVTFGYVIGFIVGAFVVGRIAEHGATRTFWRAVGLMVLGNAIIYVFGTTWLAISLQWDVATALTKGVLPFLVGDAIKILIAAGVLPLAWRAVRKADLAD
jgi:biotin transport system substrate-specific component